MASRQAEDAFSKKFILIEFWDFLLADPTA
jgi:hypothetical protein